MEAYPLHWPEGWPKTPAHEIELSRFKVTPDAARQGMLEEIRRLVGYSYQRRNVILSTNLKLRLDGEPYTKQRPLDDKGVAVYFEYKNKPMVFACNRWSSIHDNMHAIAKSIEALRGLQRWGASDMLERAFKGFVAIEHKVDGWEDTLKMGTRQGQSNQEWLDQAELNFKGLATTSHPDKGGSNEEMAALIDARDRARTELG